MTTAAQLPARTREQLEYICLTTLRGRTGGLQDLTGVTIEKTSDDPNALNWIVTGYDPPLPAISRPIADDAIAKLRATYRLA